MSTEKLRNIGPKSMAWLRQTGIRTLADLTAAGSLPAFVRIKRAGFKPSLNLLYALEGAILDCHWQEIPEERRTALIAAAELEIAKLPKGRGKVQPAAGAVTTTHMQSDPDEGAMPEQNFGFDDPSGSHDSD
ncbi:TfoX/Sxy family protein [Arenimonas oryziterrae]|uniref:TfoX C-terminal domain-containing protein n=1 Tax=Arenimonas oryziterrae DSM 21050 = YC6267 TaxID=1121015 RepID=A0A091AQF7_9GAMM|nr:TfoX/Sxy family protein [Arenimonas oryziterrae]KFN42398.1 hypothetical protein N789_13655 [Arenimonas oryziterrae DSM 21050 = YC6267]